MFIYNSYANNNKKALMTLKQRICWRTPCWVVTGTCQLMIMRKLHRSLHQVHFKPLHNDTRALLTAKSPLQRDRNDHLHLEFVREPNERYRYAYRPIPMLDIINTCIMYRFYTYYKYIIIIVIFYLFSLKLQKWFRQEQRDFLAVCCD